MNSYYHAVISAKKHGGIADDYMELHSFIDSSKSTIADSRHRALLHNTFGIFLCERIFGAAITNSEGKNIPTRILAEEHVLDDLGFIPTVEHYLGEMPLKAWMSGTVKKTKTPPKVTITTVRPENAPIPGMDGTSPGIEPTLAGAYMRKLKGK